VSRVGVLKQCSPGLIESHEFPLWMRAVGVSNRRPHCLDRTREQRPAGPSRARQRARGHGVRLIINSPSTTDEVADMAFNSLQDLYHHKLQIMADAEQQEIQALPRLAQEVRNEQLRQALQQHLQQTQQQAQQIQQLAQQGSHSVQDGHSHRCESMHALIQEAQQTLQQIQDPDARDAFIIAAAQAVEHEEIAAYGTLHSWAQELGRQQDAQLLEQILNQEKQADQLLTQTAESRVNQQAKQGDRQVPLNAQSESSSGQRQGSRTGATGTSSSTSAGMNAGMNASGSDVGADMSSGQNASASRSGSSRKDR
jgi:ferritin-like metal-binding protein YciE